MKLKRYESQDLDTMLSLYQDTVKTINLQNYNETEIAAWLNYGNLNREAFDQRFLETFCVLIVGDGFLCGFANMTDEGTIDMFYVSKDVQRNGVGRKMIKEIENHATINNMTHLTTFASITAVPFFKAQGFECVKENTVLRNGVALINYEMIKPL